jgi:hypothetical protein
MISDKRSDKKQAHFHDNKDNPKTISRQHPGPWLRRLSASGRIPGRQSGRLNPEPDGRNGIPEDCGTPGMGHFRFPSSLLWFTQSLLPSYRFPSSPLATRHLGRTCSGSTMAIGVIRAGQPTDSGEEPYFASSKPISATAA